MAYEYRKSLFLGLLFCSCLGYETYTQSILWLFCAGISFLALLVQLPSSFVHCYKHHRNKTYWWFIPSILCIGFVLSAPLVNALGVKMSDRAFARNISDFAKVVQDLKSAKIPCGTNTTEIVPQKMPQRIFRIMASKEGDGEFNVIFAMKTGTYMHRYGYLYSDCDQSADCLEKFKLLEKQWNLKPLATHWYQFNN